MVDPIQALRQTTRRRKGGEHTHCARPYERRRCGQDAVVVDRIQALQQTTRHDAEGLGTFFLTS